MATSFGTEEFRIDVSQVARVKERLQKVERLFGVKVTFDVLSVNGDDSTNQWLVVSGNKENRRKATRYIQSMCNPEQTTSLKVSGRRPLNDVVLEDVERSSNAFIQRTGSLTLLVRGSELECALAVSHLEQACPVVVTGTTTAEEEEESSSSAITSQTSSGGHQRATTEAMNSLKDMVMDSSEASNPPSMEDSRLFGPGRETQSQTDSPSPLHVGPTHPQASKSTVSTHTAARRTGEILSQSSGVELNLTPETASSSVVVRTGRGSVDDSHLQTSWKDWTDTKKTLTLQQWSEVKDTPDIEKKMAESESQVGGLTAEEQKQKLELQSLCLGMGYTQKDIEDTWLLFDSLQTVQPLQFLKAVDGVRANRIKLLKEDGRTAGDNKGATCQPVTVKGSRRSKQKGKQRKTASLTPPSETQPNTGKSAHHSPSAITISPEKNPSLADSSLYIVGEEGLNDSVIFVGEEKANDRVRVDASSDAFSSGKPFPRSPQRSVFDGTRKRKEYSDDEDQTKVLKPYASPNRSDAGRQEGQLESAQAAAEAATIYSHPSAAAAAASSDLRFIVIDGSNVAMCHGNDKVYSCRGIQICVEYFLKRGHQVKVWVPLTKTYRKHTGRHPLVTNQEILEELKEQGHLGYTPARTLNNKHVVSHDDPFILELAQKEDGVIVSNDNFREFVGEFRFIIENRLLSFAFSNDHFMLPRDPLGRNGPSLEQFLRKSPFNPQKQAATNFNTVRRGPLSHLPAPFQGVQAQARGPPNHSSVAAPRQRHPGQKTFNKVHFGPRQGDSLFSKVLADGPAVPHRGAPGPSSGPARHVKVTEQLLEALKAVFPEKEQEAKIQQVLDNHCAETDLNKLTNYCIAALNL